MAKRIGLGRGLDALLDNNDKNRNPSELTTEFPPYGAATPEQIFKQSLQETPISSLKSGGQMGKADGIIQVPVDKLVPNSGQPRKKFDETELNDLAASIKTHGIIMPLIAADAGDGTYILIAGERRTRAAKLAGLETVPVILRDYTGQKQMEVSLIENIQRTDLNPIEEAAAFKNLMDFSGLSQEALAERVGKNRSTVSNALRLLKLPVEMQKSVEDGSVSSGHARALLSINNVHERDKLHKEILNSGLSVRETEKRAGAINAGGSKSKTKSSKNTKGRPPELDAMVEKFITKLGTKVTIDGDLNKGRILIDYYSMEDLERLYEILG